MAKSLSDKLVNGSLTADMAGKTPHLIFNDYLNAGLIGLFM